MHIAMPGIRHTRPKSPAMAGKMTPNTELMMKLTNTVSQKSFTPVFPEKFTKFFQKSA